MYLFIYFDNKTLYRYSAPLQEVVLYFLVGLYLNKVFGIVDYLHSENNCILIVAGTFN